MLQAGSQVQVPGGRRSVQINLDQVFLLSLHFYSSHIKVEEMYIEEGSGREMYEEQYDSHGVLIRRDGDQEEDFGEVG